MADVCKVDYWEKRWENNDSPWHKTDINPCLEKYYERLIPSEKKLSKPRIFVPLCGKSLDMAWLASKGFQVVGLEGAESAVQSFFEENNMPFDVKTIPGKPAVKYYCGTDQDITIYVMDLFDSSPDTFGELFDAIWDRGSMSAIGVYVDNRGQRYADLLTSLLHPRGRIMLEHHFYLEDPGPHQGPPSHIPDEKVHELYGNKFDIEILECDMPVGKFRREYCLMTLKT